MQRTWRGLAYWLKHYGFLSLSSYRNHNYQHDRVPPTMLLTLLYQSLINKMPSGFAYILIIWRYFLNRGSNLSNDFNFCQFDMKLSNRYSNHQIKSNASITPLTTIGKKRTKNIIKKIIGLGVN